MKKTLLAGGLAVMATLSGCASSHNVMSREVESAQGVNVVNTDQGNVIGSISMRRDLVSVEEPQVAACLASNVQHTNRDQSAAALPSQPGQAVATEGSMRDEPQTQRISGWGEVGEQTLAYRLELQTLGDSNYYFFDQLGLAATRSDDVSDYRPLGAWEREVPTAVYQALSATADRVQQCLIQSTPAA
ncbi:hypothetical protein [Halotalea alkalilenta]|uniref:hypothetical protein n=1 Tax=Halotalea alkalilenta TaxID=376489 RepID=UPI00048590D3|nr:hypothetical protein [Halotalea alkalilenta]